MNLNELFTVDVADEGDNDVTFTLRGELDASTVHVLREPLEEAVSGSPRRLVLDMTGLEFVDSTGLGLLATTRSRLDGCEIVVRHPASNIRKVLDLSGLSSLFVVED